LRLASESPMAMACLLLLTRLPLFPLFNLPFFSFCIARLTDRCALLPYLAIIDSLPSIDGMKILGQTRRLTYEDHGDINISFLGS
jgi:hypothetical protein